MTTSTPGRYQAALAAFDAANESDPNRELWQGEEHPKELLYSRRMSGWLQRLEPDASEALRLAVRCQHLCRFKIPREDYPMDRRGYLRWRNDCKGMHAELAGKILRQVGYDEETRRRVQDLVQKKRLKLDPEAQLLEDVACLVFLDYYLEDFARKHEDAKVIDILRKTWRKMSTRAHAAALALDLGDEVSGLVGRALSAVEEP